jgi:NAD(P)-dependent dehydrogenase (short-subunit alcohol dehydrogenase family)
MATAPRRELVAGGDLRPDTLSGEVVIVSGGGGGIGLEAARSLLWLGATVVIAELDRELGRQARQLLGESSSTRFAFVETDVGDESSVSRLLAEVVNRFGKVDAVLNNATYAPSGMAVAEAPIEAWDRSYAVNLRGPVLLARACLPGMIERRHGVFICVSSTGGPFLAPYETLKAAQLELANSLEAELEGTGVVAFTIGPGLVPTQTASTAIEKLAPRLGMTVEQFWSMNQGAVLSVEAAGAGFAAAVALAERYAGQEISSTQALVDAGIEITTPSKEVGADCRPADTSHSLSACMAVRQTLQEQAAGWKERSFFERQWMLRDFKQRVGTPVERCLELLENLEHNLQGGPPVALPPGVAETLQRLALFYGHLGELARGYVKDPSTRDEQVRLTGGWTKDVERLQNLLQGQR